ncbi:MAG TPA: hypothetical protein VNA89_09325 [Gemmatimonadaceae bacterium]|nr:hypothetical protein [Gemmatimonadaceae bacterium]
MTRSLLAACAVAAGVALAPAAGAQRPDTARAEAAPAEYVRSTLETYNAPGTRRYTRRGEIAAGERVPENVAVYGATLVVGGEIGGRLVAINGDVVLRPGSRIAGDVLVVGGTVSGADSAHVGGGVQAFPEVVLVRETQGSLALAADTGDDSWVERLVARGRRSGQRIGLGKVGVYNRVEGLPIGIGPIARTELPWGALWIRAQGIYRLNEDIDFDGPNVGHDVSAHVRIGMRRGIAVGGHLFDVVEAVEPWQLADIEVSLATFFLHRDYRDYYGRHGGAGDVAFFNGDETEVTLSYGTERWLSPGHRDPFTVTRNGEPWRPNPAMDVGRAHLTQLRVRHDTRNDVDDPWSGWLVTGELELGRVRYDAPAPTDVRVRAPIVGGTRQSYRRLVVDARRYNRIAPGAQVNLRVVAGGWAGGDDLPLQRRLSVGGPATLPGFDFRGVEGTPEVGTCAPEGSDAPGAPALCERVLLVQGEYRGELRAGLFDWMGGARAASLGALAEHGDWVLLANAGRGWLVGDPFGDLVYRGGQLPSIGTFRVDVGAGLDFGVLGFYVAKAVSRGSEPPNFIFRARHRF